MSSLLGGSVVRHSMGRMWSPTPEPYYSVSARVSNSSSPRRSIPPVQIGCSQLSPLQEQAQQGRATGTLKNRSREFFVEGDASRACGKGASFKTPLGCVAIPTQAGPEYLREV